MILLQKFRENSDLMQVFGQIESRLELVDDNCARIRDSDNVAVIMFQFSRRERTLAHTDTNAVVSSEAWAGGVMTRRHSLSRYAVVVACCVVDLQCDQSVNTLIPSLN